MRIIIKNLFLFSLILVQATACFCTGHAITQSFLAEKTPPTVFLNIYVHGTLVPGFALFSPLPVITQHIEDSCGYVRTLNKIRCNQRSFDHQLILQTGLIHISPSLITQAHKEKLSPDLCNLAAVHVAANYDEFMHKNNHIHLYYTYGWDGVLCDNYRQRHARDLYHKLTQLKQVIAREYPNSPIRFIVHGHSHGGNIILYLAKYENEYKKGLVLDHALLYGTPIQTETAHYCVKPIFKTITLFYSLADVVQIADIVSVASKTSKRKFSDLLDLEKIPHTNKIQEVCLQANGNSHAFGHMSFFYFEQYSNRIARRNGKYRVFRAISPLPLVTFSPIFIDILESAQKKDPTNTTFYLNIKATHDRCVVKVKTHAHHKSAQSCNIKGLIDHVRKHTMRMWRPKNGSLASHRSPHLLKTFFCTQEQ